MTEASDPEDPWGIPARQNGVNIWKSPEPQLGHREVFTFCAWLIAPVELLLDNRRQVGIVTALSASLFGCFVTYCAAQLAWLTGLNYRSGNFRGSREKCSGIRNSPRDQGRLVGQARTRRTWEAIRLCSDGSCYAQGNAQSGPISRGIRGTCRFGFKRSSSESR